MDPKEGGMLLDKNESCLLIVDVQEKLTPHVLESEFLVERCQWLMKLAYDLDVPVLMSEQYPQGLGCTVKPLSDLSIIKHCVRKVHFSGFDEPSFLNTWQEMHKQQVIIAGIETHVCVLQTAMDMKKTDIDVFVVVDAVSSRHQLDHKFALKRMMQAGIHLITSEMVFFEWVRKAGTPEFKALSKTYIPRSNNETQ
jgi:nicotinamidase-related amidase